MWFINIVLVVGVIFFAVKTFDVWFKEQKQFPVPISSTRQEIEPEKQVAKRNLPPESAYRTIADKNLFSEDRKEYLPPTPDPELESTLENETEIKPFDGFGKSVTLYGVLIWNDLKKALITNPDKKNGEPQDIWVQKGDTLLEIKKRDRVAALKVDEILNDRILVRDESSKYEILLYDKEKSKKREMIKMDEAPEVIAPRETPRAASRKRPSRPQKSEAPETMDPESKNEEGEEPQFEIINTPFGEIKRRIN
ncbi:MAG: hypothetical protein MUD09_09845 [Desulfobacterales bacterium]|nr:hypothetical protein [Desulfobacterales bacterium]